MLGIKHSTSSISPYLKDVFVFLICLLLSTCYSSTPNKDLNISNIMKANKITIQFHSKDLKYKKQKTASNFCRIFCEKSKEYQRFWFDGHLHTIHLSCNHNESRIETGECWPLHYSQNVAVWVLSLNSSCTVWICGLGLLM